MIIQQNITQSFQSPTVLILLVAIAIGLLYVLWREVRKIPAKLFTLMATAFVDMLGLLMIIPLLPFYVKTLGGSGIDLLGMHFGIGIIMGFIVASFTFAQLLSAPMWGRFSDRVGRRPTLLIALGASAIAYLIFGFAHSLLVLFLSRIVLVPVIAAFAYELVRFGASHYGNPLVRAIYAPGLWLQSLTTRPPDRSMLEVSIASLESCLASDREAAPPADR